MNFKLKNWKIITSILIPLIIWIIIILTSRNIVVNGGQIPGFIVYFLNIHDVGHIFSIGNIFLFLIEIIIIYILLSLFDKK